jgi:protein required for attachment to host cells
MRVRVVVADQSEARYYDLESPANSLRLIRKTMHPQAHMRDRDLVSDRPGRVFDHANLSGGRRGSVAHHATGGERSPRKIEALKFARQIAEELDTERRHGDYDRLVVVSGPNFLGLLRANMPKMLQAAVALEIAKDLVHCTDKVIGAHVSRRALESAAV